MNIFPSKEKIKELATQCGIAACGIVSAEQDLREYGRFLEFTNNLPPELAYMRRPWDKRRRLSLWDARAKSAVVCAFPYWDKNRDYPAEMAAINAGITGVCALWGNRSEEQLKAVGGSIFAENPSDLMKIIL